MGVVIYVRVLVGVMKVSIIGIVVCKILYEAVTGVKYGEEYLIEDISRLDCFTDIEDNVLEAVATIDGEDIDDVIDDINLLPWVDIFTGTSGIIFGVVIDAVIVVDISDVFFTVDMSSPEEDGVNKSEIIDSPEQ